MSVHKSLKLKNVLSRSRNVFRRVERIELLEKDGRRTKEDSVFGLPKVRTRGKVAKKKAAPAAAAPGAVVPGAAAAPAAAGAAAAKPAAGGKPAAGAAPAGKGAPKK